MLKTNRLNCMLTEEISMTNVESELKTCFNANSEIHVAESAVKKFSGNCIFPSTMIDNDDIEISDEQ